MLTCAITMSSYEHTKGKIDVSTCSIVRPFTGELTVVRSEAPVKSIELQLVRVETCGCLEGYAKDVRRKLALPSSFCICIPVLLRLLRLASPSPTLSHSPSQNRALPLPFPSLLIFLVFILTLCNIVLHWVGFMTCFSLFSCKFRRRRFKTFRLQRGMSAEGCLFHST